MSVIKEDLFYTEDHEWVKIDGQVVTIGITDHAQSELGDIVFVELPEVEDTFDEGESCGTIEAVKTVADIFNPIEGEVVEANEELEDNASNINEDPYGSWIYRINIDPDADRSKLMSAEEYKEFIS